MKNYDFALNKVKLNQAIAKLGVNATEEEIKAEYIRRGGLIQEEDKHFGIALDPLVSLSVTDIPETATNKKVAVKKATKKVTKKAK